VPVVFNAEKNQREIYRAILRLWPSRYKQYKGTSFVLQTPRTSRPNTSVAFASKGEEQDVFDAGAADNLSDDQAEHEEGDDSRDQGKRDHGQLERQEHVRGSTPITRYRAP
jgi:hypothetical protein